MYFFHRVELWRIFYEKTHHEYYHKYPISDYDYNLFHMFIFFD
jgi:hypothetical protein